MKMEADSQGFLIGASIAGADGVKLLDDIKGDTGRILAVMLKGGRLQGGRPPAVTPARRPMLAPPPQMRDAAGRFIAAPARSQARGPVTSPTSAAANPVEGLTTAVAGLNRTQELQRREAKAEARSRIRGADGRFGAGGRGGVGSGLGGFGASLGGGVGRAAEGLERVDPMLEALGELNGAAAAAGNIVAPVGRSIGGILGRNRGGDDDSPRGPTGLLRRLWREIRGMRKEQVQGDKALVTGLKGVGSAGGGGGLLGFFARFLLPVLLPLFVGASAAIAAWFTGGGLYRWFTELDIGGRIGKVWDQVTASIQERWNAGVQILADTFEPARKWLAALGDWVMNLPGIKAVTDVAKSAAKAAEPYVARGREMAGQAVTAAKDAAGRAYRGAKDLAGKGLGAVSAMFESGRQGAAAVSTGKGDRGGASYGKHQLASKTGTLQKFLQSSGYAKDFAGMEPGTPEFNAKWKEMSKSGAFNEAQQGFIKKTHFDPQMAMLGKAGIDLSGRGKAVQEAVYSTSVQFGGNSSLIKKALRGKDVAGMSDADIVSSIQDYKVANNDSLFRSSSDAVRSSTLKRAGQEKTALLSLAGSTTQTNPTPAVMAMATPSMPTVPAAPPIPAEPTSTRLNSPPAPAPAAAPAAVPSQEVSDRNIAHIVSGGLGGGGFVHNR